MADWAGFSDEELRRLKHQNLDSGGDASGFSAKSACFGQKKRSSHQERLLAFKTKKEVGNTDNVLPSAGQTNESHANSSSSKASNGKLKNKTILKANGEHLTTPVQNLAQSKQDQSTSREASNAESEQNVDMAKKLFRELDDSEILSQELNNLEKFQKQQKCIEELNKQKKQLLAKAIKERKKKAEAEAGKLIDLQKDLNHLDSLLSVDVSIIRDRIETSSIEYLEAQKRYEKCEKEFVAAKMELFQKAEMKEKLTEHLYTIIYQNEVRKAKKLSELMEKLEMEVAPAETECHLFPVPSTMFNMMQIMYSPTKNIQVQTPSVTAVASSPPAERPEQETVSFQEAEVMAASKPGDSKETEEIKMILT